MGSRILIVDDERDLVDAYMRLLERSGHVCFGAFNAADAIKLIDSERPGLIVTDLSLADGNGLEVLLHARAKLPGSPVIVITGQNTSDLAHKAREAGATECLLKPVPIISLKRIIEEALAASAH
ncbi:MAG TPA: response regulator [Candidatus Binataceae bacterium]